MSVELTGAEAEHKGDRLVVTFSVRATLRTRSDRHLVRFYLDGIVIKTHPRMPPGGRSTDPADFPPESLAYARRDIEFLTQEATKHGPSVGAFAREVLAGPLPWTKMRRVYALLTLCKRLGSERVEAACTRALAVSACSYRSIKSILEASLDGQPLEEQKTAGAHQILHANVRGAAYYAEVGHDA